MMNVAIVVLASTLLASSPKTSGSHNELRVAQNPIRPADSASVVPATMVADAAAAKPIKVPEPAATGRFAGVVRLEGKAPEAKILVQNPRINNGRPIRDESLRINRTADNGIANVFVYLREAPQGTAAAVPKQAFVLQTNEVVFTPRAAVVRVRQLLKLRNVGLQPANVHIFPARNSTINHLVMPGRESDLGRRFTEPEWVPFEVRSDIYPWMRGAMLVVDHPFATVTDELGAFEIGNLPPGKYSFEVWHERAGYLEKNLAVEIEPHQTTKTKLSYAIDRFP